MTSGIIAALDLLTRPASDVSSCDSASPHRGLLVALRSNRAALLQQLRGGGGGLEEVRRWREEVMEGAAWLERPAGGEDGGEDAPWWFVQECLLLLLVLARHLSAELERFERTAAAAPHAQRRAAAAAAPPLPPDVLSVAQQRTLGAALQFVVSLGLCPYLSPGVGVSLHSRSAFGATVEALVRGGAAAAGERRLHATSSVLLQVSQLSSLAAVVFTQHLGDLMAALCQLGHRPPERNQGRREQTELSPADRKSSQEALRDLLERVHQPMVIKELLVLQGGAREGPSGAPPAPPAPAWLRRLCGRLLSDRLVQPNGVQAVVRAVLEGGTGGASDWRRCEGVARVLVTCPRQAASAEEYYGRVCPQLLDLLRLQDRRTAPQLQRVATRAALWLAEERSAVARRHLLEPLVEPLRRCRRTQDDGGGGGGAAAVEEEELSRCMDHVFKVWVVGNGSSEVLVSVLEEVLPVVFRLFCFSRRSASHLRAPCQDTLLWFLTRCPPPVALSTLRLLSGLGGRRSEVGARFHFTPGSEGGARFTARDRVSEEDEEDEEDEALYQDVSEQQWSLECLMFLLSQLQDSDLPGDFFLSLLQELTSWTVDGQKEQQQEEQEQQEELDLSSMSLLQVEQQVLEPLERNGQKVALLQVLAVMVETLEHGVLLRKTTQVVDFMVSLVQRACASLDQDQDQENPVENPVEEQSLRMGVGVVAALLSGPQLSSEEFSSMSRLLSPLETLSQLHPDRLVQGLASDLRAVIATRGAFRPQNLRGSGPAGPEEPEEPEESRPRPRPSRRSRTRGEDPAPPPPPASTKAFSDWLLEACDPDVPTRTLGLRVLTRMVQEKNPEALEEQEKVLTLFLENLQHQDSFVYLSAIQGLVSLVDVFPEKILERLLEDFRPGPSANQERSLETRLKVGEVLMRASRAMGDLAPHLGRPLLGVFLQGTRDPEPAVRTSSLSNLGELSHRLDWSLGPLVQEVSVCLVSLMRTETEVEVRRAAVHVVTLLLRGLGARSTEVLSDVLLDLYRALKWAAGRDPDQVVLVHAQLALEELDQLMRNFIFPQQKLEKKIVVLPGP